MDQIYQHLKTINGNDVTFEELVEIVTKAFGDTFIAKAFAYTAEARGATNIPPIRVRS